MHFSNKCIQGYIFKEHIKYAFFLMNCIHGYISLLWCDVESKSKEAGCTRLTFTKNVVFAPLASNQILNYIFL